MFYYAGVSQETPAKNEQSKTTSSAPKPAASTNTKPKKILTPEEKAIELYRSAELYKRMKKYNEAITDYNAAIENNPNMVEAFVGIASTKFLMLDFDAALGDYNSAIDLAEKLIDEYKKKAKIKKILEDLKGAKIEEDKIKALKPTLAEAYYQRGELLNFLDDKAGACKDIRKAKELGYLKTNAALEEICGE